MPPRWPFDASSGKLEEMLNTPLLIPWTHALSGFAHHPQPLYLNKPSDQERPGSLVSAMFMGQSFAGSPLASPP
jgi:hypothetical protein